jgi:hypothetical protein
MLKVFKIEHFCVVVVEREREREMRVVYSEK